MKDTKGTPPAVRQGAKVGGKNYTIRNKFARRVCRGLNWEFVPRNLKEEIALAAMLDSIKTTITEYARKVARRAISKIGRKD